MDNVKIAKELLRLARSIIAEKTYVEQWKDIVLNAYKQEFPEKYNLSSLANDRHSEEELAKVAVEYFEEKKKRNTGQSEDFLFVYDVNPKENK